MGWGVPRGISAHQGPACPLSLRWSLLGGPPSPTTCSEPCRQLSPGWCPSFCPRPPPQALKVAPLFASLEQFTGFSSRLKTRPLENSYSFNLSSQRKGTLELSEEECAFMELCVKRYLWDLFLSNRAHPEHAGSVRTSNDACKHHRKYNKNL